MTLQSRYWRECLFPLFLKTISSCTFVSLSDEDLSASLDIYAIRAISRFRFPKVSLEYLYDIDLVEGTTEKKGYYFLHDVTHDELRVLLAWMKYYYIADQLSKEELYQNVYADKDVKAFSSGNLLTAIRSALQQAEDGARLEENDYSRVTDKRKPAIGEVNV